MAAAAEGANDDLPGAAEEAMATSLVTPSMLQTRTTAVDGRGAFERTEAIAPATVAGAAVETAAAMATAATMTPTATAMVMRTVAAIAMTTATDGTAVGTAGRT